MENKGYWKNSIKIAGGFLTVALMAFVTTRTAKQQQNEVPPVPVDRQFNCLQFYDRSAIQPLAEAWNGSSKIVMVHTGDSHIQPDFFTHQTRKTLQALKGDGGIGLVFPFSAAKTYSSTAYTSKHIGEWTFAKSFILPAKIPLGAGGMAIKTIDKNASFEIHFKEPTGDTLTQITLFYNHLKTSYNCLVQVNGQNILVESKDHPDTYPKINVKGKISSVKISLATGGGTGAPFEFYGMNVESASHTGLVYHAAGVGGAQYKAILHQKLFAQQLAALDPQLVVVDYGTNDYLYDDSISPTLEKEMREVIATIKKTSPKTCILLTTTQDLYWKKRNCKSAQAFGQIVKKLARENHCLFYDWFNVSGGQGAILKWKEKGYAQADLIHLTKKGYVLKGELFAEALVQTIEKYNMDPGLDSLIVPVENKIVLMPEPKKTQGIAHLIQKGETLSGIAKKYSVRIEDIKTWNNLSTDKITAGETLEIRK